MSEVSNDFFNPLTIPYLPDTYFPYAKRALNYRPYNQEVDMENPRVKRPRIGRSPIEHTNLVAMKQLERATLKNNDPNYCATHRTLIDIPIHILKYLQSQGMTQNKTNQAMDVLSNQVTDLTRQLESAIRKFSQPAAYSTQQKATVKSPESVLLTSYYSIIEQTLHKFKRFHEAEITRSYSLSNQSSSAHQYNAILTMFDCILKIRDLIMIQCNFDCSDGINTSIMWPVTPGNVSLTQEPRTMTWNTAYAALMKMEANLRTYMECLGIFDGNDRRTINDSTRGPKRLNFTQTQACMPNTTVSTLNPLFTSTPRNSMSSSTIAKENKKRKCVNDNEAEFNCFLNNVDTRKKLNSKRCSFSFERGEKMEIN